MLRALTTAILLTTCSVFAGHRTAKEEPQDELDRLWALANLYSNPDSSFLQELSLSGYYGGEYYAVSSNRGNDDGWEHSRLRWGLRARVLHDFYVRAEVASDPEAGEVYSQLWNATVSWEPLKAFHLTLGKFRPQWSWEGGDSSFYLPTFERSMLVSTARPSNLTGAAVSGEIGNWSYELGIFSGEQAQEFGDFGGGIVYNASIGYDLDKVFGLKRAELRLDYLHADHNENSTGIGPWKDNFALSLELREKRWSLVTELQYVSGDADSAIGVTVIPSYFLTKKLELNGRYHFASSSGDSLRLQKNFERRVGEGITDKGRGDLYQSAYVGLTYHVKRDRLKFTTGVEWSRMEGGGDGGSFDGWTWFSGVRLQF